MSDEGLHEIQLNGKQLVFLFMTATVVAVVIFLCGVMVGRGVPAQRERPVLAADGADPTTSDDARADAAADAAATPTAASSPVRIALEPAWTDLSEAARRARARRRGSAGRCAGARAVRHDRGREGAAARTSSVRPSRPRRNAAATAAAADVARPRRPMRRLPGRGFVVQVAAVRQRTEADSIRGRLSKQGVSRVRRPPRRRRVRRPPIACAWASIRRGARPTRWRPSSNAKSSSSPGSPDNALARRTWT